MRISRDNEFAHNFNRRTNQRPRPNPSDQPWRPWDQPRPPWRPWIQNDPINLDQIPAPYDRLTLEKDMSGQDRYELLGLKQKTIRDKIKAYVRKRWPVLGSFHDRTETWNTLCFLKRKF